MAHIEDRGWIATDVTVASASGTGNATSAAVTGRLHSVEYIKDATAPYSANATFTIHAVRAGGSTQVLIFTSVAGQIDNDAVLLMGLGVVDDEGAAIDGAADYYVSVSDTLKVSVASAGSAKTGVFRLKLKA